MPKDYDRAERVISTVDKLHPAFAYRLGKLMLLINQQSLPFRIFETYRGKIRQNHLKYKGRTKANFGDSPHNYGLAADLVLLDEVVERGEAKSPWSYDYYAWNLMFPLVKEAGLVSGNDFKSFRDPPHVEMPKWRKKRVVKW